MKVEIEKKLEKEDKILYSTEDWDVIRLINDKGIIEKKIDNCEDGILIS